MSRRVLGEVDWERFEAEFADLDAELDAGSPLADRIIAVVRARRARRARLAVAAGAMLAAGLVVSLLLVALPPNRPPAGSVGGASRRDTATRAQIYAAALSRVAGFSAGAAVRPAAGGRGAAAPQRSVRWIWVSSHVCRAASTSPNASSCASGRIPRAVQQQIIGLVGRRVRFAATPPVPRADATVVRFGRLAVLGERAELGIEVCAPRCDRWQTLLLRKKAGHWTLRE